MCKPINLLSNSKYKNLASVFSSCIFNIPTEGVDGVNGERTIIASITLSLPSPSVSCSLKLFRVMKATQSFKDTALKSCGYLSEKIDCSIRKFNLFMAEGMKKKFSSAAFQKKEFKYFNLDSSR